MIVFIDAYNVLRQDRPYGLVLESTLQEFCRMISQRAQARGYRAIVVCDGGITTRKTTFCSGALTLHYAGQGKSADDLLIELCEEYQGHERIMVSADRRLCIETERLGAVTIAPHEFLAILHTQHPQSEASTSSQAKRLNRSAMHIAGEIDLLMQQASEQPIPSKESGEDHSTRRRPSVTMSRNEKKRMKLRGKI